MDEIPIFKWSEEELTEAPLIKFQGTIQSVRDQSGSLAWMGGSGSSSSFQEHQHDITSIWRARSDGQLDIAWVSWQDFRAKSSKRILLPASPCKNGVFTWGKEFLGICTNAGDVYFVSTSCLGGSTLTEIHPSERKHSIPSSCCWSGDDKKAICWIGWQSGTVDCLEFPLTPTTNLNYSSVAIPVQSTTSFDPVTGSSGWLTSLTTKKIPVLAMASSKSQPHSIGIVYADGKCRLLQREGKQNLYSEIVQLPMTKVYEQDSSYSSHSMAFCSNCPSPSVSSSRFIFMLDEPRLVHFEQGKGNLLREIDFSPVIPKRHQQAEELEYRGGLVDPQQQNSRITLWWNESQRKSEILSSENIEVSPLQLDFLTNGLAIENKLSLQEILSRLEGQLSQDQIHTCIEKTFRMPSKEQACANYNSITDEEERAMFCQLLRSTITRVWEEDQEIFHIFFGFIPSSRGNLVRKQGLSILSPLKIKSSTSNSFSSWLPRNLSSKLEEILMKHYEEFSLFGESIGKHTSNVGGGSIVGNEMFALDSTKIFELASAGGMVEESAGSGDGEDEQVTEIPSKEILIKASDDFLKDLQFLNRPYISTGTEGHLETLNGSLVGEILRRSSHEFIWTSLSASMTFAYLCSNHFTQDVELNDRCRRFVHWNISFAKEMFLISKIVHRLDMHNAPKRQPMYPFVNENLLVKDPEETFQFEVTKFKRHHQLHALCEPILNDEEEDNFVLAWAQGMRFTFIGDQAGMWRNITKQALVQFSPSNLALKTSITWFLLTRLGNVHAMDVWVLKQICHFMLEEDSNSNSANVRMFYLFRGLCGLVQDFLSNGDFLLAKRMFLRAAPSFNTNGDKGRYQYFKEIGFLFYLAQCPSLSLFFYREAFACLVGGRREDEDLVQKLFTSSLISGEYLESLTYLMKLPAPRRLKALEELLFTIVSTNQFDVLLQLPLDQFRDVLLLSGKILKQKVLNEAEEEEKLTDMRMFYGTFAFLVRHSLYESACELSFLQYNKMKNQRKKFLASKRSSSSSASMKMWLKFLETEQALLSICSSTSVFIPNDEITILCDGKIVFVKELDQSLRQVQTELSILNCLQLKSKLSASMFWEKVQMDDDSSKLYQVGMELLATMTSEQQQQWTPSMDELSLALFHLAQKQEPPQTRARLFHVLAEHFVKSSSSSFKQAVEAHVKYLLECLQQQRSGVAAAERIYFASDFLKTTLSLNSKVLLEDNDWWKSLFQREGRLDVYVDILSSHGRWLEATCLAVELVPDTLIRPRVGGQGELDTNPPWFSVKLLDKILSRAARFTLESQEANYVVDVKTNQDVQDLKQYSQAIQYKLQKYFKQVADVAGKLELVLRHERVVRS
jgi:hypothetical protein